MKKLAVCMLLLMALSVGSVVAPNAGYWLAKKVTKNDVAHNFGAGAGGAAGGLAASWAGAKLGGSLGAAVGGPVGIVIGAGLGAA